MVKTFVAAPSRKVVAGCAVKAAAVNEDLVFERLEIIEILTAVIAPVVDSHADVFLFYSDIFNQTLSGLVSHGLHRIRNDESPAAVKLYVILEFFFGDHLDPGLFINRTFAFILFDERVDGHAESFKSACKIVSRAACAVDQAVRALLDLFDIYLHVGTQVPVF